VGSIMGEKERKDWESEGSKAREGLGGVGESRRVCEKVVTSLLLAFPSSR